MTSATNLASGVPVGTILAYAGNVTGRHRDRLWQAGWLPCDGTVLQESQGLRVFKVIGRYWGGDREKGEYRLPDLRGRFARGVNHDQKGEYGDPDAGKRVPSADGGRRGNRVGSLQGDAIGSHGHTVDRQKDGLARPGRPGFYAFFSGAGKRAPYPVNTSGGEETRPVNVYVNWIIRIGPPQTGAAPA